MGRFSFFISSTEFSTISSALFRSSDMEGEIERILENGIPESGNIGCRAAGWASGWYCTQINTLC